jgi:hypothetical protein
VQTYSDGAGNCPSSFLFYLILQEAINEHEKEHEKDEKVFKRAGRFPCTVDGLSQHGRGTASA